MYELWSNFYVILSKRAFIEKYRKYDKVRHLEKI